MNLRDTLTKAYAAQVDGVLRVIRRYDSDTDTLYMREYDDEPTEVVVETAWITKVYELTEIEIDNGPISVAVEQDSE